MRVFTTCEVAEIVGVCESRFRSWIRTKKIIPPKRNASLEFTWFPKDVQRAKQAARKLLRRRQLAS